MLIFQELVGQGKAQPSSSHNEDVDLDELMDVSWIKHSCSLQFLCNLILFCTIG